MRLLVIGNPENRRLAFFKAACARIALPEAEVLPWEVALSDAKALADALSGCDALRIESPGENARVDELLVTRGGGIPFPESEYAKGRIGNQKAWFAGWSDILGEIGDSITETIPVMNPPREIKLMFDKLLCQNHLADSGVPIPRIIGRAGCAEEVFNLMDEDNSRRVFVKPRHSSSASGVVALQRSGGRILATTSARNENGRLYNSLRLSRYEKPQDVANLLDLLGAEELFVERWFPKAVVGKRVIDFRVLVIAGKARHAVARTSRSPITNLHLGNARGDLPFIKDQLGSEIWQAAMETCEQVATCFPRCLYVAVDIMVGVSMKSVAVAEVNAFGDLLPNLESEGSDTYTAELKAWL